MTTNSHRARRRVLIVMVLLVGVVWLAVGAWQLMQAGSDLRRGGDALQRLRRDATISTVADPSTTSRLDEADGHLDSARHRLRSVFVTPLRVLPVLGRQVRAADRVRSTTATATDITRDAVNGIRELRGRSSRSGPERVTLVRDLNALVRRARQRLEGLDPGSSRALVGSLHDAVEKLHSERGDALDGLARAERVTAAVADLLDGPGHYLLLGANNAEMRAGSGMFLSAAPLSVRAGAFDMGDVRPVADLVLPPGAVRAEGDMARNWKWLDVGRDPRQLGLSPDFPQSAAIARNWWAAVPGGGEVDGVISVDVGALRELLGVVGPVTVDGVVYDADTVAGQLLRAQYRRAGDDVAATEARRDSVGDVASAVFRKIEAGGWDLDDMAGALVRSAERRHLLVWSATPGPQRAWVDAGVGGRLSQDTLSVAMLNRGAEKLDPYLEVTTKVTTSGRRMDIVYSVTNRAPADGPRYQLGPNIEGMKAGEHRGIVVVNLPAGTTDVEMTGANLVLRGDDGPTTVVAGELSIERGATAKVQVTALLPRGIDRLVLEPAARMPSMTWVVDGRSFRIDRRRSVAVLGH